MFAKVATFVLLSLNSTSAAVSCESDRTQLCYVKDQKVSATETFEVLRSTPFTDLLIINSSMPSLPSTMFTSYPNITFLSGSFNGLKVLGFKNFANGGKLKKLFLSNGDLSRIVNGTFRSCVSLENLQLCHHKITNVGTNAFQGLTNLRSLHLNDNLIEDLHSSVFSMLTHLNSLSLEMNLLKSLSSNIFETNSALVLVILTSNQLVELPSDLFRSNQQIQNLNFDQNNLESARTFGSSFMDLRSNRIKQLKIDAGTETLRIDNNLIYMIECDDTDLSSLKRVYASNNSLTNFKCIQDMVNLTDLDVSANNFARPSEDVFMKLTKMRDLRIFNQTKFLKVAAKVFSPMKSISALRIDRFIDYRNLRKLFPNISQISLSTMTWNCSYTEQVGKALARQNILMNYNNFRDRAICNIKQVM